jgi:hypothetical protein
MTTDAVYQQERDDLDGPGKLLSPEERAACRRIAAGEAPWSQHAQSLLALDTGATQAAAAEQAGLTAGQVKYWLGRFRSDRLDIFPAALLEQTQPEPAQDAEASEKAGDQPAAGEEATQTKAAAAAEKPKQKKKKKAKKTGKGKKGKKGKKSKAKKAGQSKKAKKAKGTNGQSGKKPKKKGKK